MKQKKSVIEVIVYFVAVMMGTYFLFSLYNSYQYISSLVATNQIVISQQLNQVITYYMSNSLPYLFYTLVLLALGQILNKLCTDKIHLLQNEETKNEQSTNKEDDEINKFINELKNNE